MNNISFANPWLLFLALPLIAAVVVPFAITVKKDTLNFHNVASLALHIVICVCITLAIAGMSFETVVTETNVYVLADISYSSEHNLDEVQENIEKISKKLPKNSKMGVICFGRNYQMIADLGESVPDVRTAENVDRSATDIAAALRYAGNLFDDGVIKRIIVITDGAETVASNNIIRVVGALQDSGVYVDAVFIDDNIDESVSEVQIDGVEATASTYLNKSEEASVLVRVNCGTDADGQKRERINGYVSLYKDGVFELKRSASFYDGLNVVTLPLSTDKKGSYNYEVRVETAETGEDTSLYNNTCLFSQKVTDECNVLFIGGSEADLMAGRNYYGYDGVKYISDPAQIPISVEELCVYDEIVLCNFDVRTIKSCGMFTSSLTTLVDDYGKTLTTFGNTFVQEDSGEDSAQNDALRALADLLPVKIGNSDQDTRLVAIVMDISLSMNFEGRFNVAKRTANELLTVLNPTDMVMVVGFSGGVTELLPPTYLTSPGVIKDVIEKCEAENGTNLSAALKHTYDLMPTRYHDKQVIIISDGLNPEGDNAAAKEWAERMSKENIAVSAIGIYPKDAGNTLLTQMVHNAFETPRAFYQYIENENDVDVVIQGISDDISQTMITGEKYDVTVRRTGEQVAEGVTNISAVEGFWYNSAKSTAQTVLTVKYYRDKGVTAFDVPLYAYWSGGGKGKVVSFLSDISSDWTASWVYGTGGDTFLANIPKATLPTERITSPFIVEVEGSGNSTTVYVKTSGSLRNSSAFSVTVTDPDGMVTTKPLTFDSSTYFAVFSTDAPGRYSVHVDYSYNGESYETDTDFSVSYYAEYDSFTNYNRAYLYRLLTENGKILELDDIKTIENTDSAYTSYTFKFTLPLMIVAAVAFVADIIIRQLKWKDVTSFFSNLGRRRR